MISIPRAILALKIVGGGLATAAAVVLGLAFWPQVKPGRISAKPAVEQPVFVVSSVAKPAPPGPAVRATPVSVAPNVEKAGFDKLAAALKTDVSIGASPAALKTATAPAAPPPDTEAARLCARGLIALAGGDIAAARRWLEMAAEAGDPRALVALGDSYNPIMLARLGVLGAPGDPTLARTYYNRAVAAGQAGGRERLASLDPGAD